MVIKTGLRCETRLLAITGSVCTLLYSLPALAEVHTTFLATGETVTYEGQFLADEDIYAECDRNCLDLDMYLYDRKTGALIASDTLPDAHPFVTAPYDGEFWVETVMVNCKAETCQTWTDSDEGF